MILDKVLASYTFRFMSGYVASLSVAGFVVLAIIYASYSYDYFHELQEAVNHELDLLSESYASEGPSGVDALLAAELKTPKVVRFSYLVVDADFHKVAGNLERWPRFREYGGGWLSFELDSLRWDGSLVDLEYVGKARQLASGHWVLVARDYRDVLLSSQLVGGALIRSMVVTIVLGTIGGAIVAGLSVKRIDELNQILNRIMSGDLSERIPVSGARGDYFDLVRNLNRMLDRIQSLMDGVRQVADNIAHDLRTPLTRLRNRLADLAELPPGDHRPEVEALIDEADHLLATFSALLRIAQVESGNRRDGFATLDLNVVLADVAELYEPLAADEGIALEVRIAERAALRGDRDLLFQAFANLLDNAIKYTPAGGHIQVALSALSGIYEVVVADSGPGIPQSDREKVFQRFYRMEASRSQHAGNGLGLSLVQAVVSLHAGHIALADNRPGLKVIVQLPRGAV